MQWHTTLTEPHGPTDRDKGEGVEGIRLHVHLESKDLPSVDRKKRSPALMNLLNLNNLKTDWLIKIRFFKRFFFN